MGRHRQKENLYGPPQESDLEAWKVSSTKTMAGNELLYRGKDLSNQFTLAMNQILRRFIREVRGGNLAPVFPGDKGGYKLRTEQMTSWSQLLGAVEKMQKVRDMVESEESKGKIDSGGKLDNVKLFNEAKTALDAVKKVSGDE